MKQIVAWFRENPGPAFAAVFVIGVPAVMAALAMISRLADRQYGEALLLFGVAPGYSIFIGLLASGVVVALFKLVRPRR